MTARCSEKTLSVTAIREGTVIDHIQAGAGLKILRRLLKAYNYHQVTVALNLKSASLGLKDLIKIESVFLSEEQTAQIAVFSPDASVNVIDDYRVTLKYKVQLPERIMGLLVCPNHHCITHLENITTHFKVVDKGPIIRLRCLFCEKTYSQQEMTHD